MMRVPAHQLISETTMLPTVIQMRQPNTSRPQWPTADAMNVLAVLCDWLECNAVGDSSEFDC